MVGTIRVRPRVEGDREDEILMATIGVLVELGYDRLTMDAVATASKASKATLYRRWSSKADLVVEAVSQAKGCPQPTDVDTGSLRGDLLAISCGEGGFTDDIPMSVVAGLLTALHRDEELRRAFMERFLRPRLEMVATVYRRAAARGELAEGADLDLLAQALPAIAVHRTLILGESIDDAFIERVIDNIILPAALGGQQEAGAGRTAGSANESEGIPHV
jgi:AcrR family transcriptional regulator